MMGEQSAIAWCNATWNPWQGCHKVSPGCDHCYMFREKTQYGQEPDVVVRSKPRTFNLPLRLKGSQRVFTCSWSDFFIREADPWRDEAWAIIDRTRHLTYQILTKRVERVAARLPWGDGTPWPHVQIIASVENQEQADRRIPKLLAVNAAVRGVSYEPGLGPVEFLSQWHDWLAGWTTETEADPRDGTPYPVQVQTEKLDWLIIGGESGPEARPFDLAWARSTIAQCRAAGVPCFVKQLGAYPQGGTWLPGARINLRDRAGADPEEWPEALRIREWPTFCAALRRALARKETAP